MKKDKNKEIKKTGNTETAIERSNVNIYLELIRQEGSVYPDLKLLDSAVQDGFIGISCQRSKKPSLIQPKTPHFQSFWGIDKAGFN
jgi:hypothetical protein